ncbi:F0F1 ATP synthase subunit A [Marinilabilia rubra]|uniref:ATP synthase subunit a n=1 Tax=Marinilabilia rubra TaxID=2162893 RepID=A0A2U2B8S7_9BACT|nr:F0F1 ATP synthase subunit A [Marinilabilia rubra]PWD99468.1 ATP synthase F0 subunit A [Marinilabilia rubra]
MRILFIIFFLLVTSLNLQASSEHAEEEGAVDAFGLIMGHISDSHQWHVIDYTNRHGHPVHISMPLPVILWHDNQLWFYSSDSFFHAEHPVKIGNDHLVLEDGHFYLTDHEGTIIRDGQGSITNPSPLDFSITKNVASMILSMLLLLLIFLSAAKAYARYGMPPPKGFRAILEPLILFVRDDIARSQIDEDKADKFVPFLLTLFFFIWINNLIGIVPFFPGGSNLSGNISFTATLAVFAFLAINIFASKDYWKHIFIAPGMPFPIKILLVPLEFVGIFIKPFALMIRLFANITAGHIIILSLISIIFILKSIYIAPVSVLLSLVMFMLELLVAVLQAYIFTLLTALFIGMSTSKTEH